MGVNPFTWREWRMAVERMGIFFYQFVKVSLAEVRGLTLLRTPRPVAAVNGKEIPPHTAGLATATRLRESGFMTWAQYKWRENWQSFAPSLPPRNRRTKRNRYR